MSINGTGNGNGAGPSSPIQEVDIPSLAEEQARQLLGVSLAEAFDMLDTGKLDGTAAEAEFKMLRFLLVK